MTLSENALQMYILAGKIAAEVREETKKTVYEGMSILELCEKTEAMIRERGGEPAFPCNVSINEIAAHYTSPPQDEKTIPEDSLVKVDIGVQLDGYIADTATTICFSQDKYFLVEAAENALRKAVEILRPGLSISQFGSAIQKTIRSYGVKPIVNLTGHQISRYLIHTGKTLPNVYHFSTSKVNEGEVYGVEPFVTVIDGAGEVKSGFEKHIFRFTKKRSLDNPYAKKLLSYIRTKFRTLPFTERWLTGIVPHDHYRTAFSTLLSSKCLMSYPTYIEVRGKPVAQAEHTVLLVKGKCLVTTK